MEHKESHPRNTAPFANQPTPSVSATSSPQDLVELLEPVVRKILAEMLGVTQDRQPCPQVWFDTAKAYSLLDLADAEQLREMVRSGLFRLGKEVRDRRNFTQLLQKHAETLRDKTVEEMQAMLELLA